MKAEQVKIFGDKWHLLERRVNAAITAYYLYKQQGRRVYIITFQWHQSRGPYGPDAEDLEEIMVGSSIHNCILGLPVEVFAHIANHLKEAENEQG